MEKFNNCPGCGAQFSSENKQMDKDFNALAACRDLMYQVLYYTLSLHDKDFIHQLAVDAYASEHSGENTKPITQFFALAGLYLVNEKSYTGKQVQLAHIELANKSKIWPKFETPNNKNWLTVKEVVNIPDDEKNGMIKKWSRSSWEVWKTKENLIKIEIEKYITI